MSTSTAVSMYAWRRLDLDGLTFVRVERDDHGGIVGVDGQEICVDGRQTWSTRFTIELDLGWRHRSTWVEVTHGDDIQTLRLDNLGDCEVVDLAGNPFTNALVLRSGIVPMGGEVAVLAAFIETPILTVRPLRQRYTRLADDRWTYADDEHGAFEFSVDTDGIVIDYRGLATRLG